MMMHHDAVACPLIERAAATWLRLLLLLLVQVLATLLVATVAPPTLRKAAHRLRSQKAMAEGIRPRAATRLRPPSCLLAPDSEDPFGRIRPRFDPFLYHINHYLITLSPIGTVGTTSCWGERQ